MRPDINCVGKGSLVEITKRAVVEELAAGVVVLSLRYKLRLFTCMLANRVRHKKLHTFQLLLV